MSEAEKENIPVGGDSLKLLILLAAGLSFFFLRPWLSSMGYFTDPHAMGERLRESGMGGVAGLLSVSATLTFLGFPRLIFFTLGGLLLGFSEGFVVALAASMIGSFASFVVLRWCGRDWLIGRYGGHKWIGRITGVDPSFTSVFMARQLPVGNVIINAGLAMSRVRSPAFLIGSLLGFIPQGAAASLIGSGTSGNSFSDASMQMIWAGVVLGLTGLWAWQVNSRTSKETPEVKG